MKRLTVLTLLVVLAASGGAAQSRQHELRLVPPNVHWGYYDATLKPVLRIASGDTIRVETMIAGGLGRLRAAGVAEGEIPDALKSVEATIAERGPGVHPLTGPVWIEGAEPGDVLEVRILAIEFLHPYGVTGFIPGSGTLPDEFPYSRFKLFRFDISRGVTEFSPGITLRLAPFFGSIGVAPHALLRRVSSGPPGPHTGNLDNKELVPGSTLYLPVHVPGALLSLGDGHAMQGDGEVTLTALETSLRGTIQVVVHKGRRLNWPRAETPTHYIAMGLHPDLDQAAQMATREVIDFLVAEKGMTREEAYILTSVAVDLRVTQLVDGTKGVHAMIAKSIFTGAQGRTAAAGKVPRFRADASWPTIPNNWVLGEVSSVSVDAQDHVWVLQRPGTLEAAEKPRAAPPVLEFDQAGKLVNAWGGPGQGYEWPLTEHGIYLDAKGFVWIGGNDAKDHQILKFTRDGKFVMQIGRAGQSKGNADTQNVKQPADTFVHAPTNELFVADGYGNRRIIVFDADTGRFNRMWGAFGSVPSDAAPNPANADADEKGAPQFVQPVHAVRVSKDGLVYVSDRGGKRVQVFNLDGRYVTQVFIGRECKAPACGNGTTAASTAFSADPEQRFLYVANRSQAKVMVFDRKTLTVVDEFGMWGSAPGQFGTLHHMNIDSKGNLYTTEVSPLKPENRRIQKFTFLGLD